jgi:hypothetical protein
MPSYVNTSIGGCVHFFFNMEGGASAELKTLNTGLSNKECSEKGN